MPSRKKPSSHERLPKDQKEAILHMLRTEIKFYVDKYEKSKEQDSGEEYLPFCSTLDSLIKSPQNGNKEKKTIGFSPAFFTGKDYFDGEEKPFLEFNWLPRTHQNPVEQRSPLSQENTVKRRESMSPAEYAFQMTIAMPGWVEGNAFEAIVATHAVYNEACFHCKLRKCLRWSGGSSTSWRDIHCSWCGSCFEIKSKGSKEVIETVFHRKVVDGGSFRRWCQSREDLQQTREGKDYIVFVNRAKSLPRGARTIHDMVYGVEIAEIDDVTPRPTCRSFCEAVEKGGKKSQVHIQCSTRAVWFNIPANETMCLDDMAKEAFVSLLPGQWDALHCSNNHHESEGKNTPRSKVQELEIESIRKDLELLKATSHTEDGSDDEWENLYDSE